MNALRCLKDYNPLYRDDDTVTIDENNLAWMNDSDEYELNNIVDIKEKGDDIQRQSYTTISQFQTHPLKNNQSNFDYTGAISERIKHTHNSEAKWMVSELI